MPRSRTVGPMAMQRLGKGRMNTSAGQALARSAPRRRVPTDGSALDNATLLPACRKRLLTRVLYSDAIDISGVPSPQCSRPE
jgi:hypothetical protein